MMRKVGIGNLTEKEKQAIEKYGNEHQGDYNWINGRFCDKILLKDIPVKVVPTIREHSICLDCSYVIGAKSVKDEKQTSSSKTFYKTALDPMEALKKAILEQVRWDMTDDGELFSKADIINWFETRRVADKDFPFFLNKKFIADFKSRHKDFVSYDDLKKERDFLADKCASQEKRLAQLESEHNLSKKDFIQLLAAQLKKDAEAEKIDMNIPFAVEVISHFLGIEVSKGDTVYNPGGAKIDGFSYDLISKYLKETELFPDGRRGNSGQTKKSDREEDLKKMKDMFSRKEYRKLKDDFGKIR
jgi:hypothetical protein